MFNCHCRACQQVTGAAYVPVLIVPSKAFKLTKGALRYHFTASVRGERHPNKRGFCADCGSPIYATTADDPQFYNLRLGAVKQRVK